MLLFDFGLLIKFNVLNEIYYPMVKMAKWSKLIKKSFILEILFCRVINKKKY